MKITLQISERQAAALLVRLVQPIQGAPQIEVDRPAHFKDVEEFRVSLAVALERELSRQPKAPAGPHAHIFVAGKCKACGEPEPQTCENGYHLYEGGFCSRCKVPEPTK